MCRKNNLKDKSKMQKPSIANTKYYKKSKKRGLPQSSYQFLKPRITLASMKLYEKHRQTQENMEIFAKLMIDLFGKYQACCF